MARTAAGTAKTLIEIYDETFRNDCMELYRITWPQLRLISGVPRLDNEYISSVNESLRDANYVIIPFDDYFVVARDTDFQTDRKVPDRIIENYIDAPEDDYDEELENDSEALEHG